MKRVVYHRRAAAELLESARFYDQRRAGLGDEFLTRWTPGEVIAGATGTGKSGPSGTLISRTWRFPFHNWVRRVI